MPDNLTLLFEAWKKTQPPGNENEFSAFQGGLTAGAVSMRERAMACIVGKDINKIKNAIGALSDIP